MSKYRFVALPIWWSVALGFFFLFNASSSAQTCVSIANGNWNNANTWSCDGVNRTPTCGDTVLVTSTRTVTVSNQNDYEGCSDVIVLDVAGILSFTNGNKLELPCGSVLSLQSGGLVRKTGAGGGNSTLISICNSNVWTAGDGDLSGPISYGGAILPIKLLHFSAFSTNDEVRLEWSTASEINNDYFSVYESDNGENWLWVQMVIGAGTTNHQRVYQLDVRRDFTSRKVYRLDQTDHDGTTKTVGYAEGPSRTDLSRPHLLNVFPNPSRGIVHVSLPETSATSTITLVSHTGAFIKQWTVPAAREFLLDGSALGLEPGVYFIKLEAGSIYQATRLVIE